MGWEQEAQKIHENNSGGHIKVSNRDGLKLWEKCVNFAKLQQMKELREFFGNSKTSKQSK